MDLHRGETLTVLGSGQVWRLVEGVRSSAHAVSPGTPCVFGTPGRYELDGDLAFTVASVNAWVVTKGSTMALADKFKHLADRAAQIPKALETRADALTNRLDKIEARGDVALAGHEQVAAGIEAGVAAAEDALNQLTNGGPA